MKYLFILSLFTSISSCAEYKRCSSEMAGECHTEAEWNEISEYNWKLVICMNDPKNQKKSKKDIDKLYKICGHNSKVITIKAR